MLETEVQILLSGCYRNLDAERTFAMPTLAFHLEEREVDTWLTSKWVGDSRRISFDDIYKT